MMQLFLNLDLEPSHPFLVFLSLMNINIITLYCHYVLRVLANHTIGGHWYNVRITYREAQSDSSRFTLICCL